MTRVDGWEEKLRGVVAAYTDAKWEWGRTDCAHFMSDCVRAVTGEDPMHQYRGTYGSRLQSIARIWYRGHRTVAAAARAELEAMGCQPIDPRFARVGDVGVTANDVLAVRLPIGFVARTQNNAFVVVDVEKAWAVAWDR